jgi:hypothetical protein
VTNLQNLVPNVSKCLYAHKKEPDIRNKSGWGGRPESSEKFGCMVITDAVYIYACTYIFTCLGAFPAT